MDINSESGVRGEHQGQRKKRRVKRRVRRRRGPEEKKNSEYLEATLLGEHQDQSITEVTEPGQSQEEKNSEYLEAAAYGELEKMVTLLNNGADILSKNERGDSALHRAAMMGRDEIVKELLDRGLDVNLRGQNGKTPLMEATLWGLESIFNILVEAGADVTCRDESGVNALHYAAMSGQDTMVKKLLDRGLDIDSQQTEAYETPLMLAANGGHSSTVNLLFEKGAKLNLKASDGRSAFQIILDKEMTGAREEILNSMMKRLQDDYDEAEEQYKLKRKIKDMTQSSVELRDCLSSLSDRFKWGSLKYWLMLVLNFLILLLTLSFYFIDVYKDLNFTLFLFKQAGTNFASEISSCKPDFDSNFTETIKFCQREFDATECLILLDTVKTVGENCFNQEQRFISSPGEWNTAGIISAIHCALPIVMTMFIWLIQNKFKICKKEKWLMIPFPFVSKVLNFHYTRKLFGVYTMDRNSDIKKFLYDIYKNKLVEKLRINEAVVNLSHLIEATAESSFQFWFQAVYLMPTIFISFTVESQSLNLFEWRIVSILISFGTFALTFYKIRYNS